MNFKDGLAGEKWEEFTGQQVREATYMYVASDKSIRRLKGESNILYIGSTQSLNRRHKDETKDRIVQPNTQSTNTRLSYLLPRLTTDKDIDLEHKLYFTKVRVKRLAPNEKYDFANLLRVWVKSAHTKGTIDLNTPPLETYLLVRYAADHLELPPLNNRF